MHPRYSLQQLVRLSVKDIMEYPDAASYRNMASYFWGYTRDKGKVVYVCGEVFRFNEHRPDDFKPFIVKAYISAQGIVTLSMPVIAFGQEIFTPAQVQQVWDLRCHDSLNPNVLTSPMDDGVYTQPMEASRLTS
ncbi:hypothetical protein ABN363_19755 [Providencia rettgeri]